MTKDPKTLVDPKNLDLTLIAKIGRLARLKVNESEGSDYTEKIGLVLDHFSKLAAVDVEGIEPLVTPTEIRRRDRDDQCVATFSAEEALKNAPERRGDQFVVPPVV